MENKTADIIQETRKLQIRRKGPETFNQSPGADSSWMQHAQPLNHENQLKASRDVRWQLCICGSLVQVEKF